MGKATKAIALCAIFIVSVVASSIFLSGMLQNNSSNGDSQNNDLATIMPSSPTPSTQSINQPQIQTYLGYLVSFNYVTSQTNGVESTQLVFTNKTFNYAGYIPLEDNCIYNVTYYDNNPYQALSITKIDLTIGFMNNAEQVTASDPVFTAKDVTLTLRNTGASSVTITTGTIDGAQSQIPSVATGGNLTISKGSTLDVTLTSVAAFTPGAQYQLSLVTSKGTTIVYTATYNP